MVPKTPSERPRWLNVAPSRPKVPGPMSKGKRGKGKEEGKKVVERARPPNHTPPAPEPHVETAPGPERPEPTDARAPLWPTRPPSREKGPKLAAHPKPPTPQESRRRNRADPAPPRASARREPLEPHHHRHRHQHRAPARPAVASNVSVPN